MPRSASTPNQMCVEAAFAVMRALRVRTGACGELHGSLLMWTVCRAAGVYSERARLSLVHIHPRYRGTPPNSVRLNFCMAAELSDATVRDGRSTPFHWPTR